MKYFAGIVLSLILINTTFAIEIENSILNATITKNKISDNVLVYNLSNGKMHNPDCEWAEKCTKNCIYIDHKKIENLFYIPCLVCGGNIFDPLNK